MANHLTPDELAKEMGIDRDEVIRICIEEGVPIYHGKIDKTLFQASLEAVGTAASARPRRRTESSARARTRGPCAFAPCSSSGRLLAVGAASSRRRRSP